jgi:hypothetical protein
MAGKSAIEKDPRGKEPPDPGIKPRGNPDTPARRRKRSSTKVVAETPHHAASDTLHGTKSKQTPALLPETHLQRPRKRSGIHSIAYQLAKRSRNLSPQKGFVRSTHSSDMNYPRSAESIPNQELSDAEGSIKERPLEDAVMRANVAEAELATTKAQLNAKTSDMDEADETIAVLREQLKSQDSNFAKLLGDHHALTGRYQELDRANDKLTDRLAGKFTSSALQGTRPITGEQNSQESEMEHSSSSESEYEGTERIPQDANARATKPYKVVLKVPALPPWSGGNQKDEDQVNVFLPRLAQYLQTQQVSKRHYVSNVLPFLKGRAFQLWDLHSTTEATQNRSPTWEDFTTFMKKTFGNLAPERSARLQYDQLTQTKSAFVYVSEMKKLVQLMKPMPMVCPGEADIIHHFIKNAKHDVRAYLTEHCPPNFWASVDEVFDHAIQYATNQAGTAKLTTEHKTSYRGPVKTLSAHTRQDDNPRQGHPANPNYHGRNFNSKHRANRNQGLHGHAAGTFSAVVGHKRPAEIPHYKERAKAMAESRLTKSEIARRLFWQMRDLRPSRPRLAGL